MNSRPILFFIVLSLLASCKRINPDKPTFIGETAPLPKAISYINAPLDIPLSFLEDQLNNGLKELMVSETDLVVGDGINTDLDMYRTGKISLSAVDNRLQINLPLRLKGNLHIKQSLFGQVLSTSIPYDETISPVISFVPQLKANWDLGFDQLKIESWGKSLTYNLLGFEIDLDPILRRNLEKLLNNQNQLLSSLNLKSLGQKAWQAFSEPIKIQEGEVDAYLYTIPQEVKINQEISNSQHLKLLIGLQGEVMTHIGNRPNVNPAPLPDLSNNEDSINHIDLTLPLIVSYKTIDNYLNQHLANQVFKIDASTQMIPRKILTQSFGDRALVKMEFTLIRNSKKDIEGELYLVGKPTYYAAEESIVFENIDFDLNTKNFFTNSASWLRQGQLLDAIEKHTTFPIGTYIDEARSKLRNLNSIRTDFATFNIQNPTLDIQEIYVTENDLRLYLDLDGRLEFKLTDVTKILQ